MVTIGGMLPYCIMIEMQSLIPTYLKGPIMSPLFMALGIVFCYKQHITLAASKTTKTLILVSSS